MEVLISPTEIFNLDQPISKLIDNKICVYDCSDKDYQDFFFKKISTFISYRYPSVSLLIGDKYRIDIPLNWRILVTNKHEQICRLVPIEDLMHFENQLPVFSPFHPGLPRILNAEIFSINANPVEHFVPKTPKKNLLALPIGNKNMWETKVYDINKNTDIIYPDCIYACDDIDTSKMEFELCDMIG